MLNRVGFRALDFSSSTAMGVSVRTHRENPWDLLRLARAAMPDVKLQFNGRGARDGSDHQGGRGPGTEVIAALTYTISPAHDDAFYARIAREMSACPHIDRAYLKDPAGILTPDRARTLIPAVRAALASKPLELHSHASLGLSPLTSVLAADLGVSVLQVGCGALGNGTSPPDAERLVANLRASAHRVDVNDRLLASVARYFDALAAAEGLPAGKPGEYDAAFLAIRSRAGS